MSSTPTWQQFADADGGVGGVRVVKVVADTHEPLGQEFLADPLSAMLRQGVLDPSKNWNVQLQVVNADIPTGPLPLPDEIDHPDGSGWWWVIRKIIIIILIFEELELVVAVVRRFETDRAEALDVLERSRAARRGQT
jgi:hypothetical protein